MANKQKIGEVFTYFSKVSVAGIKLTDGTLAKGDTISIEGHTTNFEQNVVSIQIDREEIEKAEVGQEVGIKVKDRVRLHDNIYKIS